MSKLKKLASMLCAVSLLCGLTLLAPPAFAAKAPRWQPMTPMPNSIQNASAVTIGEKIYITNGSTPDGALELVYAYDTVDDSWSTVGEIPASFRRTEGAAVALGDKIYILGGYDSSGITSSLIIYDTATNIWSEGTSLSTPRSSHSAAAVDGKIYTICGRVDSQGLTTTKDLEIYDPASDTWTKGANLSAGLRHHSVVALNQKLYVIGGQTSSVNESVSEATYLYDIATDTWETKAPMPVATSRGAAAVIGDEIYFMGGTTPSRTASTYIYNAADDTWRDGPSLLYQHHALTAATAAGVIYAMGGANNNSTVEALAVQPNQPTPPTPTADKLAVLLNPKETVQLSVSNDLSDNTALTWTSSNPAVATVDASGKVTAVAPGLCDVSAKSADGTFNESIPIRVLPGTADQFRLAVHLRPAQTAKLYLTETPTDTTWKSLDPTIATVDANGKVAAVSSGLVIMEGSYQDKTYQIYVRVSG